MNKPEHKLDIRWHWCRVKSSSAEEFEPAQVDYKDGAPWEVWFAGCDYSFDADQCEIAEECKR